VARAVAGAAMRGQPSRVVKRPVASITMSTPCAAHGILLGSFSLNSAILLPLTCSASASAFTFGSCQRCTESCVSK
jgi:hypothetical protein